MADPYTTLLTGKDQTDFEKWRQDVSAKSGREMSSADYDMEGAFKSGATQAANGHFTDQFKKPNHMTFSTDSQYSGKQFTGGEWKKEGAGWAFHASKDNLKFHSKEDLVKYFKSVEPDSKLYLPGDDKPTLDPIGKPTTVLTAPQPAVAGAPQ